MGAQESSALTQQGTSSSLIVIDDVQTSKTGRKNTPQSSAVPNSTRRASAPTPTDAQRATSVPSSAPIQRRLEQTSETPASGPTPKSGPTPDSAPTRPRSRNSKKSNHPSPTAVNTVNKANKKATVAMTTTTTPVAVIEASHKISIASTTSPSNTSKSRTNSVNPQPPSEPAQHMTIQDFDEAYGGIFDLHLDTAPTPPRKGVEAANSEPKARNKSEHTASLPLPAAPAARALEVQAGLRDVKRRLGHSRAPVENPLMAVHAARRAHETTPQPAPDTSAGAIDTTGLMDAGAAFFAVNDVSTAASHAFWPTYHPSESDAALNAYPSDVAGGMNAYPSFNFSGQTSAYGGLYPRLGSAGQDVYSHNSSLYSRGMNDFMGDEEAPTTTVVTTLPKEEAVPSRRAPRPSVTEDADGTHETQHAPIDCVPGGDVPSCEAAQRPRRLSQPTRAYPAQRAPVTQHCGQPFHRPVMRPPQPFMMTAPALHSPYGISNFAQNGPQPFPCATDPRVNQVAGPYGAQRVSAPMMVINAASGQRVFGDGGTQRRQTDLFPTVSTTTSSTTCSSTAPLATTARFSPPYFPPAPVGPEMVLPKPPLEPQPDMNPDGPPVDKPVSLTTAQLESTLGYSLRMARWVDSPPPMK